MDPSLLEVYDLALALVSVILATALLVLRRNLADMSRREKDNAHVLTRTITQANSVAGHTTGTIEKLQEEIALLRHLVGAHGAPVHTHTLTKRSEHEDAGRKIVVKTCDECNMVFRDRKEEE